MSGIILKMGVDISFVHPSNKKAGVMPPTPQDITDAILLEDGIGAILMEDGTYMRLEELPSV